MTDILHENEAWGKMQIKQQGNAVHFSGSGSAQQAKYGEILRIWGMRGDKAPLLIGVAQPDGTMLTVERTLSTQYLAALGYYPELPERYIAAVKPPQQTAKMTKLQELMQNSQVTAEQQENAVKLSCAFRPDAAFPFAFAFCLCHVHEQTAFLLWDEKTDRPIYRNDLS